MTNSSWLMNNVASRLSRVVPANDLKSLNKLINGREKKRSQIIFVFSFLFLKQANTNLGDETNMKWNSK